MDDRCPPLLTTGCWLLTDEGSEMIFFDICSIFKEEDGPRLAAAALAAI
jgi:hypothetical protein